MNSVNNAQLDVMTNDITQQSSTVQKSATVQLVLTDSTSQHSSAGTITGAQTFTKNATINFWLKDPCINAVLTATTVANFSIVNGESGSQTFMKTQDTIEVLNGLETLCGPRTYTISSTADFSSGAANWIVINAPTSTPNQFTIVASPNNPVAGNAASIGANTLYLKQ